MGHNGVGFKVHRGIGLAYGRYRGCNFPAAPQYLHDDNSNSIFEQQMNLACEIGKRVTSNYNSTMYRDIFFT